MKLTIEDIAWLKDITDWIKANYKNLQISRDQNSAISQFEKKIFGQDSEFNHAFEQYSEIVKNPRDEDRALNILKDQFATVLMLLSNIGKLVTLDVEKPAYKNFLENVCIAMRRVDEKYPSENSGLKQQLDLLQNGLNREKALTSPAGRLDLIDSEIDHAIQNFSSLKLNSMVANADKQIIQRFQNMKTIVNDFRSQLKDNGSEAALVEKLNGQMNQFLTDMPGFFETKHNEPAFIRARKRDQSMVSNIVRNLQGNTEQIMAGQTQPVVAADIKPISPMPAEPEIRDPESLNNQAPVNSKAFSENEAAGNNKMPSENEAAGNNEMPSENEAAGNNEMPSENEAAGNNEMPSEDKAAHNNEMPSEDKTSGIVEIASKNKAKDEVPVNVKISEEDLENKDLEVMDTAFASVAQMLEHYQKSWKSLKPEYFNILWNAFQNVHLLVTKYRMNIPEVRDGGEIGLLYLLYKGLYDLEKHGVPLFHQGHIRWATKEEQEFHNALESIRKALYPISDRLNQTVTKAIFWENKIRPFNEIWKSDVPLLSQEYLDNDPFDTYPEELNNMLVQMGEKKVGRKYQFEQKPAPEQIPDNKPAPEQILDDNQAPEQIPDDNLTAEQKEGYLYYIKNAKTIKEKFHALYSYRSYCESVGSDHGQKIFYLAMAKDPALTDYVIKNGQKRLLEITGLIAGTDSRQPADLKKADQRKELLKICEQSMEDIFIGLRFKNEMENQEIQVKAKYDKSVRDMHMPHAAFTDGASEADILRYTEKLMQTMKSWEQTGKMKLQEIADPQQALERYVQNAYNNLNPKVLAPANKKMSPVLQSILDLGSDHSLRLTFEEIGVLSGTGSPEYTRLHQDYARYLTRRRTPSEDCVREIKDVFLSAKDYLFKKDTTPFHDDGKKRVAVAARLMAQAGIRVLPQMNTDAGKIFIANMKVEMLRSPIFRKELMKELDQTKEKTRAQKKLMEFAEKVNQLAANTSDGILISGKVKPRDPQYLNKIQQIDKMKPVNILQNISGKI